MTPEERAAAVYRDATGPVNITRYACAALEARIAAAIRTAVLEEREACADAVERIAARTQNDNVWEAAAAIRGRTP